MANSFTISDYAAWYAAFVATLGVVLHALVYLKDRPRIRVTGDGPKCYYPPPHNLLSQEEAYLEISVVNIGRRPVTIVEAGVEMKGGSFEYRRHRVILDSPEIQEGQKTRFLVSPKDIDLSNIKGVYAIDTANKCYRGKFKK